MKKRIIAFVLLLTMMFSVSITAGANTAAIAEEYTDSETLFMGLGLISRESYDAANKLTRGEFATLVSKILLFTEEGDGNSWYDSVFGESETEINVDSVKPLFSDVDASHNEYNGIRTLVSQGYMKGIGADVFAPNSGITVAEALKVVVSMLGYDEIATVLGGYPNGYLQIGNKCKLLNGVNGLGTDVITARSAVALLSNAFEVQVKKALEITNGELTYKDAGETFMNFFMQLDKVEGRMTDNGYTTLVSAGSRVGNENMVVGGKTLKYAPGARICSEYIGREVVAYYSIDNATKDMCYYMYPDDNVTVITDGTEFKNGVLYYENGNKYDNVNIPRGAVVVYNGVYADSYTDEMLTVNDGVVTLIKGKSGDYIVVVKKYKDMMVSSVSYDAAKIYSELKFSSVKDGYSSICLEPGETFENVLIFDEYGNEIAVDGIVKGDVLSIAVSADGKTYAEVHKCAYSPYELELDAYTSDEFITLDSEYKFSSTFAKATNKPEFKGGETYKVYLNNFGRIVWISKGATETNKVAIYTGTSPMGAGGLTQEYAIRLYTQEGKLKVFNLPEKLTVNGKRVEAEDVAALIDDCMGKAVLYDAKDDVLTNLVTPALYGEEGVKEWYHVSPVFNVFRDTGVEPYEMIYYEPGTGGSFGWSYFAYNKSSSITIFTVPTSEDDFDNEKRFFVNRSFSTGISCVIEAYSSIKNDPVPEVLVIYEDAEGGSDKIEGKEAFLISQIINKVNEDGEPVKAFKGYKISYNKLQETTITVAEDAYMSKPKANTTSTLIPVKPDDSVAECGPRTVDELEPGDIVRYGTNGDGEISIMRISFDYSQMKGFDESKWVAWASFSGPVLNVNSKGLKLVTDILPENIDYTKAADVQKIRGFAFSSSYPLIFVKKTERGLNFRVGTYSDITSYEMTGDSALTDFACMLTHYTGGRMGGVIYVK